MPNNPLIQVAGLPRCGTAFVSTMLNLNPFCIAFHDLAATDRNWKDTIATAQAEWLYVADVSTYGFLPKASVPGSVKIFIDKPWMESRAWAAKAFGYETDESSYAHAAVIASEWAAKNEALVIPQAHLWTIGSMRAIWDRAFQPGQPFPELKVSLMLGMDIQRRNPEIVFGKDSMDGREAELI